MILEQPADWCDCTRCFDYRTFNEGMPCSEYIHFKAKNYKLRWLLIACVEEPLSVLRVKVGSEDLENALMNELGEPVDEEARLIDSSIYHYIDNNAMDQASDEEIALKHLDLTFVVVTE